MYEFGGGDTIQSITRILPVGNCLNKVTFLLVFGRIFESLTADILLLLIETYQVSEAAFEFLFNGIAGIPGGDPFISSHHLVPTGCVHYPVPSLCFLLSSPGAV